MGAMVVISLYLLLTQAANTADGKTPPPGISRDASGICSAPKPQTNVVGKGISASIVATGTGCSIVVNMGNFWIGVVCGLAVIVGMTMARKD